MSDQPPKNIPIRIVDPRDPRIAMFTDLKDRELAARHGLFVAEGEHLVRRLLASDFVTAGVLVSHRIVGEIAPLAPAGVPVYSASDELLRQIVGFKFHTGALACGHRRVRPDFGGISFADRAMIVVCPEINSAENLGSILRISAGFGADAVLLGPRCVDPFYRQCVRVSMGTIFKLPIIQPADLHATLRTLRERDQFQLLATVLDESADSLDQVRRAPRTALLLGSEAQGLDRDTIDLCDRKVTIPMKLGTDSLNVAVAAGIFLYELSK